MPIIEAIGDEEDDSMSDRWAALLANAAGGSPDQVPPSFPAILRELTAGEAQLLDALFERTHVNAEDANRIGLGAMWPVAFDNLVRLQVATHPFRAGPVANIDQNQLNLTHLGRAFVSACRPPSRMTAP
jgi:hypothetical protein